jgi:hypothetical protein
VGAITCLWSTQIIQQGFWPEGSDTDLSCEAGVQMLVEALGRARQSAATRHSETAAIVAFRSELRTAWGAHPTLTRRCASNLPAYRALREVERLRYAEEQALRYEARDVAVWRRALAIPEPAATADSSLGSSAAPH